MSFHSSSFCDNVDEREKKFPSGVAVCVENLHLLSTSMWVFSTYYGLLSHSTDVG